MEKTLILGKIEGKNGWSKLTLDGNVYYAVSDYLTTDLAYVAPKQVEYLPSEMGIETQFVAANQLVTAKKLVNLRKLPSVEHEDAEVLFELHNGDVASCVGVSDTGWSKLIYKGVTCYAVSSYLTEIQNHLIMKLVVSCLKVTFSCLKCLRSE